MLLQAKEFGEAEVWMNERLMRAAPGKFADFVTAFEERPPEGKVKQRVGPKPLWLVWKYEGSNTLWNLMQKRDFPYNLEPLLLGKEVNLPKGPQRSIITIRMVMLEVILRSFCVHWPQYCHDACMWLILRLPCSHRNYFYWSSIDTNTRTIQQWACAQVLQALKASHATGIVHRDVKPQNVIISETDARAKLIDLGAAADLRVGINYVPNEFLLDPRYAPPQQYIMSTQTPRAPPVPVAATLSPILWRLNNPDRFDMYSAGVLLLQMVFAPLRTDNALVSPLQKLVAHEHTVDCLVAVLFVSARHNHQAQPIPVDADRVPEDVGRQLRL